jgi:hypothetical protein
MRNALFIAAHLSISLPIVNGHERRCHGFDAVRRAQAIEH